MGQPALLPVVPGKLHVLALLHVELRRPPKRHPRLRRAGTWQLDYGHTRDRQRPVWRPGRPARRAQGEQGPQRVLLPAAAAGHHRPVLAGLPRQRGHPPVLGGFLPVLHDRPGHRALPEPDTAGTARTRLRLCRLVLCLCHLGGAGRGSAGQAARTLQTEADGGLGHRRCGRRVRALADGEPDVGRPRPLGTIYVPRLRSQLSEHAAREG